MAAYRLADVLRAHALQVGPHPVRVLLAQVMEQHGIIGPIRRRQPGVENMAAEAAAVALVCFWLRRCSLHALAMVSPSA